MPEHERFADLDCFPGKSRIFADFGCLSQKQSALRGLIPSGSHHFRKS